MLTTAALGVKSEVDLYELKDDRELELDDNNGWDSDSFADLGIMLFYCGFTVVLNLIIAPDTVSACLIWLILGVLFAFMRIQYHLPAWYMDTTFSVGLALSLSGCYCYGNLVLNVFKQSEFKMTYTLLEQELITHDAITQIYFHVIYSVVYLALLICSYTATRVIEEKGKVAELV